MPEKIDIIKTDGWVMDIDRIELKEQKSVLIDQDVYDAWERIASKKEGVDTDGLISAVLKDALKKYPYPEKPEKYPEGKYPKEKVKISDYERMASLLQSDGAKDSLEKLSIKQGR